MNMNQWDLHRQGVRREAEQNRLINEWAQSKGIKGTIFREHKHKDTLQAMKVAKGILDNPKYPLTAQQAKQFQTFLTRANKGNNTGPETIDVFRQARAIKRKKTVSS